MPRTAETFVYKFSELSPDAKQKAIDWMRHTASFDTEFVYDYVKDVARTFGLEIDKIYYTGFWSQGDGACFEGSYYHKPDAIEELSSSYDIPAVLDIVRELQTEQAKHQGFLYAITEHSGHYYHSGCMQVEVSDRFDTYRDIGNSEDVVKGCMRLFADWIYAQLEAAYEAEQEDDYIIETIEANEYEFTADGNIYK